MRALGTLLLTATAASAVATGAHAQPASASDWPSYNRTLRGDRFAPQTAVTPATAPRLHEICTYDVGSPATMQAGPIVVQNVLYVTTAFDLIALDATTCAVKWRTTEAYTPASPLVLNRGAAYADGRLFRGTQDGRVLAYDAATGKRVWATQIADPTIQESVPAALVTWDGLVFAGNAGGDVKGVKGRMYALDAASGRIVWEQYLVPRGAKDSARGPMAPAPAFAAQGWANAVDVPISGGATWTSYTVDPATGTLYVPGGNPAPDFVPQLRPGVNPFAGSLIALDARTGAMRRAFPMVERDFHDWDVSSAPAVVTTRGGIPLVASAIKNGRMYGFDRTTGKQQWSVATTTILNASAPITTSGTRFCPGTQGGSEWNGAAYSPTTNLLYVGAVDWCTTVTAAPEAEVRAVPRGAAWSGGVSGPEAFGHQDPAGQWAGWVTAVDADNGRIAWQRKLPGPILGAVTPTAGGVVFTGDMTGHVYALDAKTGATVWSTSVAGAVGGGIVSYGDAQGEQRIAVVTGLVSPLWPTAKVNARITVYGLAPAQP